jgi:hypothetical protein
MLHGVLYGYPIATDLSGVSCKRFSAPKLAGEEKLFAFAGQRAKCDERCYCRPKLACFGGTLLFNCNLCYNPYMSRRG